MYTLSFPIYIRTHPQSHHIQAHNLPRRLDIIHKQTICTEDWTSYTNIQSALNTALMVKCDSARQKNKSKTHAHTNTHNKKQRQTERQTNRETGRQTETKRQTDRQADKHTDRQTDRQKSLTSSSGRGMRYCRVPYATSRS